MRDDRGRPLHIFGQVEDITDRVGHSARHRAKQLGRGRAELYRGARPPASVPRP